MIVLIKGLLLLVAVVSAALATVIPVSAQQAGARLALVIGNGAYPRARLPTAANDAGLVAQTLTAAGFDVTGARDLDSESVRRAIREFLEKTATAGPDAIAFVYLSGYALQFEGDNYFVPVDAVPARDADIPLRAIRLPDLTRALAAQPLRAGIVVVDGSYSNPSLPPSTHLAEGLALVDPEPGILIAFNAAPGTLGPTPTGTYGVYGQALAEMMRDGGVSVEDMFDRVRLRVNQATQGGDVPWNTSKLATDFMFFQRAPDAPAVESVQQSFSAMSRRAIREFPEKEAYLVAVARDELRSYNDFLAAYADSVYAARVRRLITVRREALIWHKSVGRNSPDAYWTYLRGYPHGPHVHDARRRLVILSAALQPPPSFAMMDYGVPPPPEVEEGVWDRPVVLLSQPDDPPPPPPPLVFLPPRPATFIDLPPPRPPMGPGLLPVPVPTALPYVRSIVPPGQIAPPGGFRGSYAQPHPFAMAPDGGLMVQPDNPASVAPGPNGVSRGGPAGQASVSPGSTPQPDDVPPGIMGPHLQPRAPLRRIPAAPNEVRSVGPGIPPAPNQALPGHAARPKTAAQVGRLPRPNVAAPLPDASATPNEPPPVGPVVRARSLPAAPGILPVPGTSPSHGPVVARPTIESLLKRSPPGSAAPLRPDQRLRVPQQRLPLRARPQQCGRPAQPACR